MLKVLLLGQSGQLAQELRLSAPAMIQLKVLSFQQFSCLAMDELRILFQTYQPHWVINAVAFNAVDQAQLQPELALAGNFYLVQKLQQLCALNHSQLLHISSDYVFDGSVQRPYQTDDSPNPLNQYGKSKLLAEQWLQAEYAEQSVIIRTSWLYSAYGKNFVKTMLQLMQTKPQLKVVQNQLGSPCWTFGLAQVIWQLIGSSAVDPGLYHWADSGYCTRYQFVLEIQTIGLKLGLLNHKAELIAVAAEDFALAAERPAFSALDSSTLRQLLALPALSWQQQLTRALSKFSVLDVDKNQKDS
jgi:dTDP-4-dehydrorhamnose reductase